MSSPIRLNSSNNVRRGRASIHAGFRQFVEKMRGCVCPLSSLTKKRKTHIYIFIRRIGVKAFIYAVLHRRNSFDELRRIEITFCHAVENVEGLRRMELEV